MTRAHLQVVHATHQDHFADPWHPIEPTTENASMDEITRPELDAKLEAIEARLETKVTRIEGKLDMLVEKSMQVITDAKSLKLWLVGMIATVLIGAVGTVIGVYGANASLIQSVIAAFETGRSIGQQQSPPQVLKKN